MSILQDLTVALTPLGYPMESGVFSGEAPSEYLVLVPLSDSYGLHADNAPRIDVEEVRLSLFCKGNYLTMKKAVMNALLAADFTITARQYIGFENESGYHHYAVDVAKHFELEEQ